MRVEEPFIFAFGLPYLTNRISVNTEQEIVNVRLLSICPPDALRPYFQEGYLAGTEDVTDNYESKIELDFNKRLLAKYQLPKARSFWGTEAQAIPKGMLYPGNDAIKDICRSIRQTVSTKSNAGSIGHFLQDWAELEGRIIQAARRSNKRTYSVSNALNQLERDHKISRELSRSLNTLRKFRNDLVHNTKSLRDNEILEMRDLLSNTLRLLSNLDIL